MIAKFRWATRPATLRRARATRGVPFAVLALLALLTMGSTCIVTEEVPGPPLYEEPGVVVPQNNAERMEQQEEDIVAEENR